MVTVDLSWTDNASSEDGFLVYRATGTSPTFSNGSGDYTEIANLSADTTAYSDTNAPADATVQYAVTAFNADGESSATKDQLTVETPTQTASGVTSASETTVASTTTVTEVAVQTASGVLEAADGAQAETGTVTSPPTATVDAPATASADETVTTTTIGASTTTDSSQARDSATVATTGASETVDSGLGQVSSVPDSFPDAPFTYVDLNDNFTVNAGDASKFSENSSPSIGAGIDGTDGFVGDGIDDYVTYDDPFAPNWYNGNNVSLSAWFNTSSAPAGIVGNAGAEKVTSSNGWVPSLYVGANGKVHTSIFWHGDTKTTTSSNSYDDGEWHHAVATYDDGTETLYVDGKKVGQRTGLSQKDYNNGDYFYYVGACRTGSSWPNDGGNEAIYIKNVDEVRVYDRALSASEANTLFNNPTKPKAGPTVTGTTTPDTGQWRCNQHGHGNCYGNVHDGANSDDGHNGHSGCGDDSATHCERNTDNNGGRDR